jgi:hypothetical protein
MSSALAILSQSGMNYFYGMAIKQNYWCVRCDTWTKMKESYRFV